MVNWILEDGVFGDSLTPLIIEIQAQDHHVKVIDYSKGLIDYKHFFPENECTLFYGSLHVAEQILSSKLRSKHFWIPGIIGTIQNYYCTHYYSYFNKWLLNAQHRILSLEELSCRAASETDLELEPLFGDRKRLFIRPDSPLKPFAGGVYSQLELANLKSFMSRYYLDDSETKVVVAPESEIEAEWRAIIAEGQVLSASQYRQSGKPCYKPGMPANVQALAEVVAQCEWQPDPIWVLDLCWVRGAAYILEINFWSCSAFYQCNLHPIVKAAASAAQRKWEETHLG